MAENAVGTIETLDANAEAITYAIMWLRQLEVCPTGLSTAIPPPRRNPQICGSHHESWRFDLGGSAFTN